MKFIPSLVLTFAVLCRPGMARVPDTLLHPLFSTANNPQPSARQGESVGVDGNIAVVGIPNATTSVLNAGAVKVYDAASGVLLHSISNPEPAAGDNFGVSVAVSGTRVLAGAYLEDTRAIDKGAAYVFVPAAEVPPPAPEIDVEQPAGADRCRPAARTASSSASW